MKTMNIKHRKHIKHYVKRDKISIGPKVGKHIKNGDEDCSMEVTDYDFTPDNLQRVQRKLLAKEE